MSPCPVLGGGSPMFPLLPSTTILYNGAYTTHQGATVRICGYCGQPAKGFATISGVPHCHPDEGQDCYQLAQWKPLDQHPIYGVPLHFIDNPQEEA